MIIILTKKLISRLVECKIYTGILFLFLLFNACVTASYTLSTDDGIYVTTIKEKGKFTLTESGNAAPKAPKSWC